MHYSSLPLNQYQRWGQFNNVILNGIEVSPEIVDPESGQAKGGGLIATKDHDAGDVILRIPTDLVLNKEKVTEGKRVDARFREVWEALERYYQSENEEKSTKDRATLLQKSHSIIKLFLLHQLTIAGLEASAEQNTASNEQPVLRGVAQNPFTDYTRFLPKEISLPTFYNEEELELLSGTSLADAVKWKLVSLEKEFEELRAATQNIEWCQKIWWDANRSPNPLYLDDWRLVDAMFRSRALELPNQAGDAMIPILDMCNHASNHRWNARFDVDPDDNATILVVRDGAVITNGDEVNIAYGAGGASEMIFSYGFVDEAISSARELFLNLEMPQDDPLRVAKIRYAAAAPGVRIYHDQDGNLGWDSEFIWWACVNEEDGLDFTVTQSNDGQRELKALWKGYPFEANQLKTLIMKDELRDIFVLRATVLIQQCVEKQGTQLAGSEADYEAAQHHASIRAEVWKLIGTLRELELDLIIKAYETLENEKATLLNSDVVSRYLGSKPDSSTAQEQTVDNEDFS